MLSDEVGDVRQRAYEALRKIGKPAVEPLAQALGEADERLQKRIMKVLDRMGYKRK
jgi:HEAT repeat protein